MRDLAVRVDLRSEHKKSLRRWSESVPNPRLVIAVISWHIIADV